jgi:hypothetical protein
MIYVDPLGEFGWNLRGRATRNCHMFTDSLNLRELHEFAAKLGMRRSWFQNSPKCPHYDLTPQRRLEAVRLGAVEVTRREAVGLWRQRRESLSVSHHGSSGEQ